MVHSVFLRTQDDKKERTFSFLDRCSLVPLSAWNISMPSSQSISIEWQFTNRLHKNSFPLIMMHAPFILVSLSPPPLWLFPLNMSIRHMHKSQNSSTLSNLLTTFLCCCSFMPSRFDTIPNTRIRVNYAVGLCSCGERVQAIAHYSIYGIDEVERIKNT